MSVVVVKHLTSGPLRGFDLEVGAGRHAVLASPQETAELVMVLSGARSPGGGSVRVAQRNPHRDPAARRCIGSLLPDEPPLAGGTVQAALALALGHRRAVDPALAPLGLGAWKDRKTSGLSPAERRSIALCVALATPDAQLVVLWEPFAHTSGISRPLLLERLAEVGRGSCVVCATSSVRDALTLEGQVTVVSHGTVVGRQPALASEVAPGNVTDYVVRTERARELGAALIRRDAVVGVEWNGRVAPRVVHVRGREGERTARAIVEAARAENLPVEALTAEDPSLQLAQTASLGAMRAAYDQAYRTVVPAPRPPQQLPPPTTTAAQPSSQPPSLAGLESVAASNLPGVVSTSVPLTAGPSNNVGLNGVESTLAGSQDATQTDQPRAGSHGPADPNGHASGDEEEES